MITAVIWLRSISATGISAFSGPGARTSAWKMRSVSSWRRTRVVRSIIAIVRRVVCSRRWSLSIGRPPASDSALMTDDAQTPTGSSSVIIEVAVSRSGRVAAKCSRIAWAGEPVTTRSLTWRSMIWPRSLTSVAMLSMIAVAANSAAANDLGIVEITTALVFASRGPRSPKSDVSMAAPVRADGPARVRCAASLGPAASTFGYSDARRGEADGRPRASRLNALNAAAADRWRSSAPRRRCKHRPLPAIDLQRALGPDRASPLPAMLTETSSATRLGDRTAAAADR